MSYEVPAYDDSNIFAKIIRGESPCYKVYEGEHSIAFMDLNPQSDGHILVAPKVEAVSLLDIPAESLAFLMQDVQKIARAAVKAFDADGLTIFQFNGEIAGQTVFHIHFHIIPRYAHTEMGRHNLKPEDPEILTENARKIREAMGEM